MTTQDFMSLFGQHAKSSKWVIGKFGEIRSEDGYCPICYVEKFTNPSPNIIWDRPNKLMYFMTEICKSLVYDSKFEIVNSVDNNPQCIIEVRKQLLEITGLMGC